MRVAATIACAGLLVAGCGSTSAEEGARRTAAPSDPRSTATDDPGALLAEVAEARLFATRHQLSLRLENLGDDVVQVSTIRLETPLFEPVPANRRDSVLAPAQGASMPLDYGEPRCEPGDDRPSAAVVEIDDVEVPFPLGDGSLRELATVHERECAAVRTARTVGVGFGDAWERRGAEATGVVELEQRADGVTAVLEDLRGSVIFTIAPSEAGADPLLAVQDDKAAATLPVTVTASRCDAHALIESKKSFVFTAVLTLDGGGPVPVTFEPEGDARQALQAALTACAGTAPG